MDHFHEKPNTFVGEVNINVTDLARSIDFYTNVIGLKILNESKQQAVLTANGKTALVTLEQPDGVMPKQGRTAGLYHFAILLPERKDLAAFLRHLLQTGQRFGAADHYVSEAIYIDDPDGNGIEIYRDRPSSEWTWNDGLVDMATVQLDGDSILSESEEEFTGLPAGTVMGHIHLHVSNIPEAENFYIKGLGFQVVSHYPQAIFTSTGGYHHHIALNTWQGVGAPRRPENSVGLNWYTLVFPSEEAREEAVARLKGIGAAVNDYVTEDPSGNQIQLIV
ncbi:VOC family protein [Domibacillus iocasae]|uniref:Glyoxalase n=1 Tax=Domibacillus iocasae TaxID=1714016 RepID=A0A1E7DUC9_9BACI|nr:VOC family protein [Domibacillus iocasae]OES46681.1 glyoxalase [Domibacillus iocasae]